VRIVLDTSISVEITPIPDVNDTPVMQTAVIGEARIAVLDDVSLIQLLRLSISLQQETY
jgi:hypothetical protein